MIASKSIPIPALLAAIAVAGLIVYFGVLSGGFLWDDYYLVVDNSYISGWSNLTKIFSHDIGAGSGQVYGFYRPLQVFSYLLDRSVWGAGAFGYHLMNVIFHVLTGLAVFWLAFLLSKDEILSFFASILYVVHPIHTEAVAYISGRSDPLAALFIILALIFYIKSFSRRGSLLYSAAMIVSYAIALLSREYSLVLPALVLVYNYSFKEKRWAGRFAALVLTSAFYLILRVSAIGVTFSHVTKNTALFERVPGFFAALSEYVRILIVPFGMHMGYGQKTFYYSDIQALSGLAIFIALAAFLVKRYRKGGIVFFSTAWFLVCLMPVSNIYPPINAYMAVHWLYLASAGLFLLAGRGLSYMYRKAGTRQLAQGLFMALLLGYSFMTVIENRVWTDPVAFYKRTIMHSPESYGWKACYQLANEYARIARPKDAIPLYKKTLSLNGSFAEAFFRLGNAYAETGDDRRALMSYRRAVNINPAYSDAYRALAALYTKSGHSDIAQKYQNIADK